MDLSKAATAGAVICGAYFGDKMTPLSETTILVPQLVGRGLTTSRHIRNMFWTAGPALGGVMLNLIGAPILFAVDALITTGVMLQLGALILFAH